MHNYSTRNFLNGVEYLHGCQLSIVGFPDRLLVAHMVPWNIDILDGVYRYIPPVDQSKVPDDYVPIFSNYYAVRQSVIDTKTEVRWIATTGPADNALKH
ncbi:MAG: hypothetical protein Q8Q65_01595 [bacterium]|nr:hypothetical protein [bacterium]